MRTIRKLMVAVAIGLATIGPLVPGSASAQEGAVSPADRLAELRDGLEEMVGQGLFPNAHAVVMLDGEVLADLKFGALDVESGRELPNDAIFRFYSMTKPITSVAIMMLVEEGKVALQAPVSRYLPEFAEMRVYQGGDLENMTTVPTQREITIADLLTHSSGLTYSFMGKSVVHQYYNKHGVMRGGQVGMQEGSAPPATTMDELIARLAAAPLLFQPGERWSYSNSTGVLGVVVERASGMPFEQFLAQRIFEPLEMEDTTFVVSDEQSSRLVTNYAADSDGLVTIETAEHSEYRDGNRMFDGGGALAGTMADYLHFAQMLANRGEWNGRRLLSPATVDEMFTPRFETGGSAHEDVMFGLGLGIGDAASEAIGSMPAGAGGWSGSGNSYFFVDPRAKLVAVIMTNELTGGEFIDRTIRLRELLNRAAVLVRDRAIRR